MNSLFACAAVIVSGLALCLASDPGRLRFQEVDAGGHRLRMCIAGHNSPAVIFETGGSTASGGPLEGWERVQPAVSKWTTTVSYDRAGIGWSAPGPKPRDARRVALELHAALHKARVPPPYILVGHSFGGPLVRVFAGLYPDEIRGLVLVDPTQEEFIAWNEARAGSPARQDEEWRDIKASLAEAHESAVPPGVPVILITAMGPRTFPKFIAEQMKTEFKATRPMWLKCHQEWLSKIPNASHIVTEDSGHSVPFEQPELIVEAIRREIQ